MKQKNKTYFEKVFVLLFVLILLTPSIFTFTSSRNAHLDEDISVNNPIYQTTKYSSLNVKDDYLVMNTPDDGCEIWDISNAKKPSYMTKVPSGTVKIIDNNMYLSTIDFVAIYDLTDTANFSNPTCFYCPYFFTEEIHVDEDYIYFLNLQHVESENPEKAYMLSIYDFNNWNTDQFYRRFNSTLVSQFNSTSTYYSQAATLGDFRGYQRLHVYDNLAFVLLNAVEPTGGSSIEILDISNKTSPYIRSEITLPSAAYKILIEDDIAFIPTADDSLKLFNISDPDSPTSIPSISVGDGICDIDIQDNIAYCVDSDALRIFDITNPRSFKMLGIYTLKNQGWTDFDKLKVQGDKICVISASQYSDRYFFTFECSDLTKITKLYPKGIKLDSQTEFILTLVGFWGGIILGSILVIVGIVLLAKKLKQRNLRKNQDEQ